MTKGKRQRVRSGEKFSSFLLKASLASDLTTQERILAIDVLHFLRSEHESIRRCFDRVDGDAPASLLASAIQEAGNAVEIHLGLEKDYLYPEISGSFYGVDALVSVGLAKASVIEKKLRTMQMLMPQAESERPALIQAFSDLKSQAFDHFDQEERTLLPKLREFVRTEDREDLGQVLQDVQEDLLKNRSGEALAGASGRRRA